MEDKKKQWYEDKPELLAAEKAAMKMMAQGDSKKLGFLEDGLAFWKIEFNSKLSGRKYIVALVYPEDYPASRYIYTDIMAYLFEPTYEMLLDELNMMSGNNDKCMPYSVHDCNGEWYLCLNETEIAFKVCTIEFQVFCVHQRPMFFWRLRSG